MEHSEWDVPKERIYNELYQLRGVDYHALVPFYEGFRASNPEKEFVTFLEKNSTHIEWWYKNGDKNKEDFAVTYEDSDGKIRGFFVDFVIKLKTGPIALFDTKTPGSDAEFVSKHNALINYINASSKPEKQLLGRVIVPKGTPENRTWKYCDNLINNSLDATGWVSFEPSITPKNLQV